MVGEWAQRRLPFGIEGINVWSQMPSWFQRTQGAAIFTSTSQSGAGGAAPVTEKTIPFTEAYRAQFGEAENPPRRHPMYMGFNTYDAIHFYRQAVESAGTWDYENFLDDIVDAMLSQTMVGTTQTIDLMGQDGEFPHDVKPESEASGTLGLSITQWQQEGALECVYPQSYSTSEHLAPAWM
jgi:branched-chain amino acid transport system substrate-binding protein